MYHFDLNYDVVRMRHDELVGRATRGRVNPDTTRGRRWFRRRAARAPAPSPPHEPRRLVVVPPPPPDRDPSGRDTRVA